MRCDIYFTENNTFMQSIEITCIKFLLAKISKIC